MKKIFTILVILITLNGFSQNFAPPGATWYYSFSNFSIEGYVEITYVKDTTIQGVEAQELKITKTIYNFVTGEMVDDLFDGFEYVYSDDDHVYWSIDNEFKVLYDFTVQTGDTVLTYEKVFGGDYEGDCDPFGRSLVTETGLETINGTELRWYMIQSFENSPVYFSGKIYERIGNLGYLFGMPGGCDIIYEEIRNPLRCYSDDVFPQYKNPGYQGECDFVVGISEITKNDLGLVFYPNPASDFVNVAVAENVKVARVRVYEVSGRVVLEQAINGLPLGKGGLRGIDVRNIKPGMYLLEVETRDGLREVKRVVIK